MHLALMRKRADVSQQELSRKSGVPQSVISDIENGKTPAPRIDTVYALARALGCTIDDLFPHDEKAASAR